jgi:drug/metabolite transporter (DMT)-like permease
LSAYPGELLALLSAFFFACSNVAVAKGAVGGRGDHGAMLSVVITIGVSGVLWLVLEGGGIGAPSPGWWAGIAWFALAGLFATTFGRGLLFVSIRRLGVTRASALKRLIPFFSVILAVAILGERATVPDLAGMAMIAIAFAILIRGAMARGGEGLEAPPADYGWGVSSALGYAFSYIARKYGLAAIALPAFATLISAITALAAFATVALFSRHYRDAFGNMFRYANRWLVAAGLLMSFGQFLLFAAPNMGTYVAAALATFGVVAIAVG